MGFARYLGLSSPAMTTILGAVFGSVCISFGGLSFSSSVAKSAEGCLCEQDSTTNATAIRPSSRANPTNRYGNGEFNCQNPLEEVVSTVIISLSLF